MQQLSSPEALDYVVKQLKAAGFLPLPHKSEGGLIIVPFSPAGGKDYSIGAVSYSEARIRRESREESIKMLKSKLMEAKTAAVREPGARR